MNTKDLTSKVKNFNAGSFFGNLWENIKYAAIEVWYFFSSKIFWSNFGKMFGIFMGCMAVLFGLMYLFTQHGKSNKIANLVGKHVTTAMKEARDAGFDIVVSDSIYKPDEKQKNIVLKQIPKAGSNVKDGRTIYLTISSATGIMQSLLPLKSIDDYDAYAANLGAKGIKSEIVERFLDSKYENNTIKQILHNGQDITEKVNAGGFRVLQGTTLQFIVYQNDLNAVNEVNVPELICKQFGEIEVLLQAAQLTLGTITKDASVKDERSAFITKQEPIIGSAPLPKGTPINVVLTQNRPLSCN
jgi:beta-lactam-binding protein with PASTA domain